MIPRCNLRLSISIYLNIFQSNMKILCRKILQNKIYGSIIILSSEPLLASYHNW